MYPNNSSNCNGDLTPFEGSINVNSLARAYVPFQKFEPLFCIEESLVNGTAFPSLFMPYIKRNKVKNKMTKPMPESCK